ncbi:hypothetical protein EHF_0653 [Ehrlichia japonica]|uniref:Uncharacterized protein n=1 Tax=Ehrlichia japonica TaxID=391036 RepID=X5H0K3_9RICK|nr:hypothetical protein EHF_0653 [Ehrlichia japonica]
MYSKLLVIQKRNGIKEAYGWVRNCTSLRMIEDASKMIR